MKTTLYIATHKTGYKYFGKTELYFTQEDLQKNYHGSGIGWKEYLLENGDDVTMEIYGIYNKSEVREVALKFSRDNNIVESELWSNRKEEDGFTGGRHSKKTKERLSLAKKGKLNPMYGKKTWNFGQKMTKETKEKISISKIGNIPWNKGKVDLPKGFKHSEETRKLMSKNMKGISKTTEHKQKLSDCNLGKITSEETKRKQSESMKRHKRVKEKCKYCDKEMDISSLNRYHNNNCKHK